MPTLTITLPDELAAFVESAVAGGDWPDADAVIQQAVMLLRTQAMLGREPEPLPAKSKSGTIQAVDLTRQNFDSAAFVAGLVDKIHIQKRTRPPGG